MNEQSANALLIPSGELEVPAVRPSTTKAPAIVKELFCLRAVDDPENDQNTLLGRRFLCCGSAMLFVGSTGIGKSTAVMQACICWAVGRSCFGMRPPRPLRIFVLQAENDEEELAEMRNGIVEALQLSSTERDLLEHGFSIMFENSRTGAELFAELEPHLEAFKPDILVIDPALSYIGGDANKQDVVGAFLRNLLAPILGKHQCGCVMVHHTAKPNAAREANSKVANDFAYYGTGSAEWANWPRAVMVLSAKDDHGLRELRAAKRGNRLGWIDASGKPTLTRLIRQNSQGFALYYNEVSLEEAASLDKKTAPIERVLAATNILPRLGDEMAKDKLITEIASPGRPGGKICGQNAARKMIEELIKGGVLEPFEQPRKTGRSEKWLRRVRQQLCVPVALVQAAA